MAYENKPGQFALFKNDRKEKDSHPDYKGDGMSPDGKAVWVSAWLKQGTKGKFLSCSMQLKESQGATTTGHALNKASGPARHVPKDEDDIPFASCELADDPIFANLRQGLE